MILEVAPPLKLYDSATHELRDFVALQDGVVSVYVCGMTVQAEPHLGHARSAVNFDVLRRWLMSIGYEVSLIRNVTDIDDKIIDKARNEGRPWYNLAYEMRLEADRIFAALNVLPPTYEPAVTGHIPDILSYIDALVGAGHAYAANGDVYFDVGSWPSYGELTHQAEGVVSTTRTSTSGKRDPRDFVLWKGSRQQSDPATATWLSPYGSGRPGWHIGCSTMAKKHLGREFDIHGGGIDLRFPHHENEQAQARAVGDDFASHWMHNALVTTSGEKMSKSLGNSLLVSDLLQEVRSVELRYYLLTAHYRSPIEFSVAALREAANGFRRVEAFLDRAWPDSGSRETEALPPAFEHAMLRDLGTPAAIAVLQDSVTRGQALLESGPSPEVDQLSGEIRNMLAVLGLRPENSSAAGNDATKPAAVLDSLVQGLLAERTGARAAGDWTRADEIRGRLESAGVAVEDTPSGTRWHI